MSRWQLAATNSAAVFGWGPFEFRKSDYQEFDLVWIVLRFFGCCALVVLGEAGPLLAQFTISPSNLEISTRPGSPAPAVFAIGWEGVSSTVAQVAVTGCNGNLYLRDETPWKPAWSIGLAPRRPQAVEFWSDAGSAVPDGGSVACTILFTSGNHKSGLTINYRIDSTRGNIQGDLAKIIPQIAVGGGWSTDLFVRLPKVHNAPLLAKSALRFFTSSGKPMEVLVTSDLASQVRTASLALPVILSGGFRLRVEGVDASQVQSGWAELVAQDSAAQEVSVVYSYSSPNGEHRESSGLVVAGSSLYSERSVDTRGGYGLGFAVVNLDSELTTLRLRFEGRPSGAFDHVITLDGRHQKAITLTDIEAKLRDFYGTVAVDSFGGKIAFVLLRFHPQGYFYPMM